MPSQDTFRIAQGTTQWLISLVYISAPAVTDIVVERTQVTGRIRPFEPVWILPVLPLLPLAQFRELILVLVFNFVHTAERMRQNADPISLIASCHCHMLHSPQEGASVWPSATANASKWRTVHRRASCTDALSHVLYCSTVTTRFGPTRSSTGI